MLLTAPRHTPNDWDPLHVTLEPQTPGTCPTAMHQVDPLEEGTSPIYVVDSGKILGDLVPHHVN